MAVRVEIGGIDEELGVEIRVRVRVLRKEKERIGRDDEGVARMEGDTWSCRNGGDEEEREEWEEKRGHRRRHWGRENTRRES